MNHRILTLACLVLFSCQPKPPAVPPPTQSRALDAKKLAAAEEAIESAIRRGDVPGAVLLLGTRDGVLHKRAFGLRSITAPHQSLESDAIFDLASLTKPVTAAALMILADRGRVRLDAPVSAYWPQFAAAGKADVTLEQLLLHTSGLIADNAMSDYEQGPAIAWQRIGDLSLRALPGERFEYSDVGYIVLAELVRRVDGRALDQFLKDELFQPLGMEHTSYTPPDAWHGRVVPTAGGLIGRVHDPRAEALGGVAGHAGLFSTADDLAKFCQFVLSDGRGIVRRDTLEAMTTPRQAPDSNTLRTYGFDVQSPYAHARGLRFDPSTSFGHTGFTGTMFWMDRSQGVYAILLASRLQMPGGGATSQMRKLVMTFAAEAMLGETPTRNVRTGIDALVEENFASLRGRRVGLITNHTGVDRFNRRTIDLLHEAEGVNLVAVFSPEHGIAGKLDESGIAHGKDEKTGLPIYSLYGETRRPTEAMLRDVDTLVFDIQDIGTRFYTYITTMGYAMEEATRLGKRFVVLDRPNPIMPLGVHGPMADEDKLSFIAYKPLPLTHGMTVGELARYFKSRYMPTLDLHVVAMRHYSRDMGWDDTGVPWVNPSPNMRSPTQATLYPAIGLLEMTNLSVGRGTDTPFEILGAPWINGAQLAAALNGSKLPGVRFEPTRFTPNASKFAHEPCGGVRTTLTDLAAFNPPLTGLTIAWHLKRMHGEQFEAEKVLTMLANGESHKAWQSTPNPAALRFDAPSSFSKAREMALIYR